MGEMMAALESGLSAAASGAGCSSSASGSYPSLAMRSASSFAFLSAASKSMASLATFLAPSFEAGFLAPRMLALRGPVADERSAADVVMRLAAGFDSPSLDLASGEGARAASLPFCAFTKGDGVRPTTGGVAVREMGGLGFLTAGLLQDEKKSSSSSAGVLPPSEPSPASVMTTSSGNLAGR